jgi:hypothetical protein
VSLVIYNRSPPNDIRFHKCTILVAGGVYIGTRPGLPIDIQAGDVANFVFGIYVHAPHDNRKTSIGHFEENVLDNIRNSRKSVVKNENAHLLGRYKTVTAYHVYKNTKGAST